MIADEVVEIENTKACSVCGNRFPLSSFLKKQNQCNQCRRESNRAYYLAHKEYIKKKQNDYYYKNHEYAKARQRNYYLLNSDRAAAWKANRSLKGIKHNNQSSINWARANRTESSAHRRLQKAVENGKIIRPKNCEICDKENSNIMGHHVDYSKPLLVVWVCPKCHRDLHRKLSIRKPELLRSAI